MIAKANAARLLDQLPRLVVLQGLWSFPLPAVAMLGALGLVLHLVISQGTRENGGIVESRLDIEPSFIQYLTCYNH